MSDADRQYVKIRYPMVFPFVDDQSLRDALGPTNELAKVMKSRSQSLGTWAVYLCALGLTLGMATLILFSTAKEKASTVHSREVTRLGAAPHAPPPFNISSASAVAGAAAPPAESLSTNAEDGMRAKQDMAWKHGLELISALSILLGAYFAYVGVRRGESQEEWLWNRLRHEIHRLLHFATYRAWMNGSANSGPSSPYSGNDWDTAKMARDLRRDALQKRFSDVGAALLESLEKVSPIVHVFPEIDDTPLAAKPPCDWNQAWDYYVMARIAHQLDYCRKKLAESHPPFFAFTPWKLSPAAQQLVLRFAWQCAVVLALSAHFFSAVFLATELIAHPAWLAGSPWLLPILHVVGFAAVFCGVAVQVLVEGYETRNELARYKWYRDALEVLEREASAVTKQLKECPTTPPDAWNAAKKAAMDLATKVENLSREETRRFFATHLEANFLI